jgi:hypothetical protein
MNIAPISTPYGYTIFCDDIRHEVSGKVSLIGVYAGALITAAPMPLILPRLALRISYFERPGESSDPVDVAIFMPGENNFFQKMTLPQEMRNANVFDTPDSEFFTSALLHVEISPAVLKEEGLIRVRAYRGDLEIRLGSLRVMRVAPDNTPS